MTCICRDCQDRLVEKGDVAFKLCEKVCNDYLTSGMTTYDEKENTGLRGILKHLEAKGYLLSSEISLDFVAIWPNMERLFFDEEKRKFCWCPYLSQV